MRRLLISTLAVLGALGGVALAMQAISSGVKPKIFTFSMTPSRQSVVRGGAVSLSVDVARRTTFTGATTFRMARLPRGIRASWRLADGTRSAVVPRGESGVVLTLRASARASLGMRHISVVGTAGGTTLSRRMMLTVRRRGVLRYSLRVSPAKQSVTPGSRAHFKVRVARAAGFRRRVALSVLRVPRGARATWSPDGLDVATKGDQRLGSYRLVFRGASRVGRKRVRRFAVVVLTVAKSRPFGISGHLSTLLSPGVGGPLNLVLTNPNPFDIRVIALGVRVRAQTSKPGCSGTANYAIRQYSGGYPLVLHPGSTPLSRLRWPWAWPWVVMRDLPFNQDACQRAVLSLDYGGLAIR